RLDDLHVMPRPHELADQVARLVRRDPTADADEDHGRSFAAPRVGPQPVRAVPSGGPSGVVGIGGGWLLGQLTSGACANWYVPPGRPRNWRAGRLPMRRVRPPA